MTDQANGNPELFAVFAVKTGDPTPLIQTSLTFARLMDDIVVPYSADEVLFVDGAPVKPTQLDRIKIIKQAPFFTDTFSIKRPHPTIASVTLAGATLDSSGNVQSVD